MKYKLSDLFELQMGKTPSRDNPEYWSQPEFPWISIADLSGAGKYIYDTKESLSKLAVEESGIKIIPAQTVIMSFKLSIGKVSITPVPMYSNEAIMAFIDKGIVKIKPEYLYYLLLHRDWDEGTNKAVMGKTLNKATLSDVVIDIHPIEEQERIVAVLDKASEIIDNYKRKLRALDTLIKARFVEMTQSSVTTSVRMGDVATYVNGFAFKPSDWTTEGLPIIRIQNLNDKEALYNHFAGTIDSKYRVHTGDILVSWATHLEAYVWQGGDAWLNQHIFRVIFDKMPINQIYYVYSTEEALRQAFRNAHGFKPTMEHIKRSDFENAIIELPPIEIQEEFAAFVSQVDKSKVVVQQALEKAQLLFDSLMQEYFG